MTAFFKTCNKMDLFQMTQLTSVISFVTVCVCLMAGSVTGAAISTPSPRRWHTPCAGGAVGGFSGLKRLWQNMAVPSVEKHQHYEDIHLAARKTKEFVSALKQHYITSRSVDPTIADTLIVKGMPTVPATNIDILDPAKINVEESLKKAYDDLARVAVFSEQARLDEINKEAKYGTDVSDKWSEIENTGIYPTLCDLQLALRTHDVTLDFTVTRAIMTTDFRDLRDRKSMYARDFLVLHNLEGLLHHHMTLFQVLFEHHK